jgi:hypothetical protein
MLWPKLLAPWCSLISNLGTLVGVVPRALAGAIRVFLPPLVLWGYVSFLHPSFMVGYRDRERQVEFMICKRIRCGVRGDNRAIYGYLFCGCMYSITAVLGAFPGP